MSKRYRKLKEAHPNAVVLQRHGAAFFAYSDDARELCRLTGKSLGKAKHFACPQGSLMELLERLPGPAVVTL